MRNQQVSEHLRAQVWQSMLDVARLIRYHEKMADRCQKRHEGIQFLLFVSAAMQTLAFTFDWWPYFQSALGGLMAVVVAWAFSASYGKKAAILKVILNECCDVEVEFQTLWSKIYMFRVDDEMTLQKKESLDKRLLVAIQKAGQADIKLDTNLNVKCEEKAYQTMAHQYGT